MKRMVFSDMDGTLINSCHRIAPRTLAAVQQLQARDIGFAVVSARNPAGIDTVLREAGLRCPVIACSGALILDEDHHVLWRRGMHKAAAGAVLTHLEWEGFDMTWNAYSLNQWIVRDRRDPRIVREEGIVRLLAQQGSVEDFDDDQVHKIMIVCHPSQTAQIEAQLLDHFPDIALLRSSHESLEITAAGVNKADAVRRLCDMKGVKLEDAVAFGDQFTDEGMLEAVGLGILMGNAPEALKQRIRHHTADHDHDGVALALEKLLLA